MRIRSKSGMYTSTILYLQFTHTHIRYRLLHSEHIRDRFM